jgi:nitroimidazol reductase NimA-like FMN-containing flavoprotein (pyridoxamine 5'-phosphate oxidase superfamily)
MESTGRARMESKDEEKLKDREHGWRARMKRN